MEDMNTTFYTVKEVAEILKVDTNTVYRWERAGRINFIRLTPGIVRVTQKELDRFTSHVEERPLG